MARRISEKSERVFTIELRSRGDLKSASFNGDQGIFVEGSLGPLRRARFMDDLVLEVVGDNGELRLDLNMNDLEGPSHRTIGMGNRKEVGQ